jgi:Domain of unknown function (DUF4386)
MSTAILAGPSSEMSPKAKARLAGAVYLLTIVFAGIGTSIENRLVNLGDAAATATSILAHGSLLRTGWAAYLIEMACNVALTALIYDLLKPVSRSVSRMAVLFSLTAIIIKTMSRLFLIAPFFLLGSSDALSPFAGPSGLALSHAFLHLNGQGAGLAMVFFGFYAILTGWLVIRSTFLPSFLGWLGVLAGLGWLAFLWLPLGLHFGGVIAMVALLGAAAKIGWFLIVGVNEEQWLVEERREAASIWA